MARVVNAQTLLKEKVDNGLTRESKVYLGGSLDNAKEGAPRVAPIKININEQEHTLDSLIYKVGSMSWANSEARFNLHKDLKNLQERIQNAGTAPDPGLLAQYFAKVFIDIQRQADERADYTASIYNVITREDAGEITYLRDFLPYTGKEKVISAENDTVPLIQQNMANLEQIKLQIRAFGWKDSLKNLIFNPINVLQRVTEAAANILVDSRNNDVIGNIVRLEDWNAAQYQDASLVGDSFDIKMYNTFKAALKKLAALKHPLTEKELSETGVFNGGVKILCHPGDVWSIERVIRGGLTSVLMVNQIVESLPFSEIIVYGAGIMHGMKWGHEVLDYPGCQKGYAYIFLPNQNGGICLEKRPLTLETGTGSVLALSTEERAWYRINGFFHKWFLGAMNPGDPTKEGTGLIVKVKLPTE